MEKIHGKNLNFQILDEKALFITRDKNSGHLKILVMDLDILAGSVEKEFDLFEYLNMKANNMSEKKILKE